MMKTQVCLFFSVMGLILSGPVQAQVPTSSNDNDRANALLKQMTTEEKIGQLNLSPDLLQTLTQRAAE